MASKQTFRCNTCVLIFEESQTQRSHMRDPWHIYNLKRRLESLPTVSLEEYTEKIATSLVLSKQGPQMTASPAKTTKSGIERPTTEKTVEFEDTIEESRAKVCLFCTEVSNSLDINLKHMSTKHNFFIPEVEYLSSLESFLHYLRRVITEYNECLYCGETKDSSGGIQRHMLDKGHCMMNLRREPELLEFWDLSDSNNLSNDEETEPVSDDEDSDTRMPGNISQEEYTLPSGRVVVSRNKAREARLTARRAVLKAKDSSDSTGLKYFGDVDDDSSLRPLSLSSQAAQGRPGDLIVSTRDAVGLVGVSTQQIRSLVTVQRKMQRQEAVVQASAAWADELGGRSQKHGKVKMNLRAG